MKQIITIQHTQSMHHVNGMVGSWTDWDLTPLGIEQARRIGAHLREQLAGQTWVIYTSDLLRARRTAGIIGDCLGVTPIHHVALRERNLGRAVGQSVQWLKEHMTAPERTVDDRLFPDAESRRDAWNRLRPFLQQLTDSGRDNYFIGTVEAVPTVEKVLSLVKAGNYKRVLLQPMMIVAGDHANNDMAGEEEGS